MRPIAASRSTNRGAEQRYSRPFQRIRQELLRAAGSLVSVRDYERARQRGAPLPPLPSLVVVVDEFSELITQQESFVELFVQIGRLGRSLGLHLLLASQRLDEGKIRGLEAHLSYRIGLRTFSSADSRAVLGVPLRCLVLCGLGARPQRRLGARGPARLARRPGRLRLYGCRELCFRGGGDQR